MGKHAESAKNDLAVLKLLCRYLAQIIRLNKVSFNFMIEMFMPIEVNQKEKKTQILIYLPSYMEILGNN